MQLQSALTKLPGVVDAGVAMATEANLAILAGNGLLPDKTGVWSNDSGRIGKLKPDAVMLTKPFREAGYLTLGTGKLLHGGGGTLFEDYFGTEQRWSPLPNRKSV